MSANIGYQFHGKVMCSSGLIPVGGCVGDWRALFQSLDRGFFDYYDDADNEHPCLAKKPERTAMNVQRPQWLQQKMVSGPVSRACSTTSWQRSSVSRVDSLCIDGWNVDLNHH